MTIRFEGHETGRRSKMQQKRESHINEERAPKEETQVVDYKVTMLIAAGAAMAANCEPCLNKVVPDLIEAGIYFADIRRAVEIGQFVKDRPAAIMKEAADMLTGTQLSDKFVSKGCPAAEIKADSSRG
jgi:hypothetical protein